MSGAILSLVRLNLANETAPLHDYTAGEIFERHEEIKLVDPDGCGCAIPLPSQLESADYRYSLITAGIDIQARAIRRKVAINVDYLDNQDSRRLEHRMHQRAKVMLSPNFGRSTAFSYRPVRMVSGSFGQYGNVLGSAVDLTENESIWYNAPEFPLVWDFLKGRFAIKGYTFDTLVYSDVPMIHTEGGAAIGTPTSCRNLMVPAYPESATEGPGSGNAGWYRQGTDLAQITLSHNSGGFGHPDCPDTLQVDYTNAVSSSRNLMVNTAWDTSHADYQGIQMTGAGLINVCVWIRGQVPDGATLTFLGPTGSATQSLDEKDLSGWTPIILAHYEADWSLSVPVLLLSLASTDGVAGSFEIGPTMVAQYPGKRFPGGAYWAPSQTLTGRGEMTTYNNFTFPGQGSATVSFVVPPYHGEDYAEQPLYGLLGNSSWGLYCGANSSGVDYVNVNGGGSSTFYVTGTEASLLAGKINTVTFSWGPSRQSVFLNGIKLGDVDRSAQKIIFGAATPLHVGFDRIGSGIYPALLLSARIDEGYFSDTDAMNLHLSLTDPIALQFASIARGRVFRITGIPQTLRASEGGSQVIGTIELEQVENQNWVADPLNEEGSTP